MEKPRAGKQRKWLIGLLMLIAVSALADAQSVYSRLRSLSFIRWKSISLPLRPVPLR